MAAFMEGASFKQAIDFMAAMAATGSLVTGTLAWFFRLVDRSLETPRKIDIAEWAVYGGLLGGWMGLLVFLVGSIVTPTS